MKKQILFFSIIIFIFIQLSYSYNNEHLKIFWNKKSPIWEQWRRDNPNVKPDLSYAKFHRAFFKGDFTFVNLQYAKITGSSISEADFSNANLSNCILSDTEAYATYGRKKPSIIFKETLCQKMKIKSSNLMGVSIMRTNLNEAEIINSKFEMSSFKQVSFVKTKIINSEFWPEFHNIDFSYTVILKSTIFSGFSDFQITHINFNYSKIHNSTLAGKLNNLVFINADLKGSSFYFFKLPEGSTLVNVNFTNANLTNVNFYKAKFQNVIFKNADMTGAKLERKWFEYVKKQGVRNFDKINWQ